jgi:sugar lactone lactonase YvrE
LGSGGFLFPVQDEIAAEFGQDILRSPTGLYVDADGTLYIAGAGKNTIIILDAERNLVNEFCRPSEPLFGASCQFLPRKFAVDGRQNLYILNEAVKMSGTFLNILPLLVMYFILQRWFVESVEMTGITGG